MMTVAIILVITGIIIVAILNISNLSDDDKGTRSITMFLMFVLSFFLGILVYSATTPTIQDYIHGKVKLEIRQTLEDDNVVKCDTLYYFK